MIDKIGPNEMKILKILWKESPLLASEIVERDQNLKTPTVQRLTQKMLKDGIIEVADIVQSGKVLARRYCPILTAEDYMNMELKTYWPIMNNKTDFSIGVVSALLNGAEDEKATISELERFLDKKRKELNNE